MRRCLLALFVVLLVFAAPTPSAVSAEGDWESLAPGITYREFRLPGPNNAYVARMDRGEPTVILESAIAQGSLAEGTETVRSMAARYDQTISAWGGTWGARNSVVVAINGSFFDPETGIPETGVIQSGWYAKRFDDLGGGSGFVWTQDRRAFVGGCVVHLPENQLITFPVQGETFRIRRINDARRDQGFVLYTPQFGPRTPEGEPRVEVLVEMSRPAGVVPPPGASWGVVKQVRSGQGGMVILFGHAVLSAGPIFGSWLRDNLRPGDLVGLSMEVTHLDASCRSRARQDWTLAYASIGGSFYFLRDGRLREFDDPGATSRHPRSAVCFNEAFIYFVVVDGRDPGVSEGMTIGELGLFCRDKLGAKWGLNQDGGGSSTMVVNSEVRNVPSDGHEREVANGLMMVVVEPASRSTAFQEGQKVWAVGTAELRSGPGPDSPVLAVLSRGAQGRVASSMSRVQGILAKGTYWWLVAFGETEGWVREDSLAGGNPGGVGFSPRNLSTSQCAWSQALGIDG